MPNFVDCWNSLKAKGYKHADGSEVLNDQDRASIEARIQEHLRTGLDPIESAKASVKSHLDEAHAQLQSIYDQVVPKKSPVEAQATPERISETISLLEDSIATKRANNQKVPDSMIQRLGELKSQQRGAETVNAVFSNENVASHPFNSENPVLPIKMDVSQRGLDSLKSRGVEAQKRFDAATAKIRIEKNAANRAELEVERDNMRSALKELGRMERLITSKLSPVSEAGQAPSVSGQPKTVPDFAQRFNPETLFVPPKWAFDKYGKAFEDKIFGVIHSKNIGEAADITPVWKVMTPAERQELLSRGFSVTNTRTPGQVAIMKSQDAVSAQNYYRMQEKRATQPVSVEGKGTVASTLPEQQISKTEGGTGEEVQKGQEGREAVLATERVQPPAVPPETPEALGEALKERPRSAGVANRVLQERAARGEIPQAPEAGEGHLTEDIINKSRQDYTPERAMIAAENIKNGSTNEADAGQIRIHEENLTRVARDAEKALDADPKNPVLQQAYNAAKDNLSKWHNETVQPMKTQWSNIGKSMQGATDIDTGSYIGLQKLAWDTAKRDFTPQEEPVMRTAAKRVTKATDEVRAAIAKAEDHVQKVLKPSRYMDLNQLRESLAEKLKNITC